jgi:hypothetical protein
MRIFVILLFLLGFNSLAFAQKEKKIKAKKLTKQESVGLTQEQRLVHESNRKSKKGKMLSTRKKVHIDMKQDRKARKVKSQKARPKKRN